MGRKRLAGSSARVALAVLDGERGGAVNADYFSGVHP